MNSKVSGSGNRHQTSSSARGVSPTTVELNWNEDFAEKTYEVYEERTGDQVLATTRFGKVNVAVNHGALYDFRVFRLLSDGSEKTKAYEFLKLQSWDNFENAQPTAQIEEYFPTAVVWSYKPWVTGLAASESAAIGTNAECAFLKNGLPGDDAFASLQAKIVRGSAFNEKVVDSSCSLEANANYLVSCRIRYADNTVSVSRNPINILTPSECIKRETFPYFGMDAIQQSPYVGFSMNDSTNGIMSWKLQGYDIDLANSRVTEKTLDSATENHAANSALVKYRVYPTAVNHTGLGRLQGTFKKNGTSQESQMIPKDFYIKTLDDAKTVIFPPILDSGSAMALGTSTAVGDFDCDGADDLAVGMPSLQWRDDSSGQPTYRTTGGVIVFYGRLSSGLNFRSTTPSFTPQDVVGAAARPPVVLVPLTPEQGLGSYDQSGARFGQSLAVGNFNRDYQFKGQWNKCMDLAIGAPTASYVSGSEWPAAGGSVFIAYGGVSGLRGSWVTASANSYFPGSCPGSGAGSVEAGVAPLPARGYEDDSVTPSYPRPIGNAASACSGTHLYALAAKSDQGNIASKYFVGEDDQSGFYKFERNNVFLLSAQGTTQYNARSSYFGAAVAAGDFDGDGFDDLIVGAPQTQRFIPSGEPYNPVRSNDTYRETIAYNVGAALLYFGGSNGIQQRVDLNWSGPDSPHAVSDRSPNLRTAALHPTSSTTTFASPIKFAPGNSMLDASASGDLQFGSSVAIARLSDIPTGTEVLKRNRTNELDFGGSVFIGAPGYSYRVNGGAVIAKAGAVGYASFGQHFWSANSGYQRYTQPSLYFELDAAKAASNGNLLTFGVKTGVTAYAGSVLINPEIMTSDGQANPAAANSAFGAALTSGSLRPITRASVHTPATEFGLDPFSSSPINQVLAVGAPGYNGAAGAVYLVTDHGLDPGPATATKQSQVASQPINSNSMNLITGYAKDAFSAESFKSIVGRDFSQAGAYTSGLCLTRGNCSPVKRIDAVGLGANAQFGAALNVVRKPLRSLNCVSSPGQCSTQNVSSMYPRKDIGDLDLLVAGAPGAQSLAFYQTSQTTGAAAVGTLLSKGGAYSGNMSFAASVSGGYFYGADSSSFAIVAGAPTRSHPIQGNGDTFIFEPTTSIPATPTASFVEKIRADLIPFNFGAEINMNFQNSLPVGDLNCDGYSEAVLLMGYPAPGSMVGAHGYRLLIVYGSDKGLVTTGLSANYNAVRDPLNPRAPQWLVPSKLGIPNEIDPNSPNGRSGVAARVYPVGDINNDGCDDLLFGSDTQYVFYGSPSGLVADRTPVANQDFENSPPSGSFDRSPQIVEMPGGGFTAQNSTDSVSLTPATKNDLGGSNLLISSDSVMGGSLPFVKNHIYGGEYDRSAANGFNAAMPQVCHGDFNGDGFMDIATTSTQQTRYADVITATDGVTTTLGSTQYPQGVNGFVTVYYGSEHGLQMRSPRGKIGTVDEEPAPIASVNLEGYCKNNAGAAECRISRLFHPSQFVRMDPTHGQFFFPTFKWHESFVRISANHNGSSTVPYGKVIQDHFGTGCLSVGDLDGDQADDLVIPMPQKKSLHGGSSFVIFWGERMGADTTVHSYGLSQKRSNFVHLVTATKASDGHLTVNAASALNATSELGYSGAGVGDLNGDGYNDFVLGAPGDSGGASAIVVYGGPQLRHQDLAGSGIEDTDAVNAYGGNLGNPTFAGSGGLCAGSDCYERWVKIPLLNHYLTLQACSLDLASHPGQTSCDEAQRGAYRITYSGATANGFGRSVVAVGDVNSDGFADFAMNTMNRGDVGQANVGGAIIYFGGRVGVHSDSSPSQVSRCMGDDADPLSPGRSCVPYYLLPKYATSIVPGLSNDVFFNNQTWRINSTVQFKSPKNLGTAVQYRGPNFGSRHPGSLTDTKSNDFLMCVADSFKSNVDPNRIRLGACGVYY